MTFRYILFRIFTATTFGALLLHAQHFVRVIDPANPVTTTPNGATYPGISWIDYDNDGWQDLFINPNQLYKNNGGGNFTRVISSIIGNVPQNGGPSANSWSDYDNDGDLDMLYSSVQTTLFTNNGAAGGYSFSNTSEQQIGTPIENIGWSGAWADYDNDGFTDFIVVHPQGFLGTPTKNHFHRNTMDGRFEKITSGDVVKDFAAYTVATWSDFDLDGDVDLFIGSGPVSVAAKDYLFKNMLKETGTATLQRITTGSIATDLQDGQVWNWIDYDNDGDLDAYVTNYSQAVNALYRNDNGTYVRLTAATIGTMATINTALSNVWGDVDNDGDLDCFVTRDGNNRNAFFRNNGNGTFTTVDTSAITQVQNPHIGATFGDYDNDGDLDLAVVIRNLPAELYRNTYAGGNAWITVTVKGTVSNNAALGAKVRVKAMIDGSPRWQIREISAQNSFSGHNMLPAHVGLGNATVIDSLVVEWPSGQKKVMTGVSVKQHLTVTEEVPANFLRTNFSADVVSDQIPFTVHFADRSFTHPAGPVVSWKWDLNGDGVIDATTQNVSRSYATMDTVAVTLIVATATKTDTLRRMNYIKPKPPTPLLSFNVDPHHFGPIGITTAVKETTVWIYNKGKGKDTLAVSLKYGTAVFNMVTPDSALEVFPASLVVNGGDSAAITFRVYPGKISPQSFTVTYSPRIVVDARQNSAQKKFEKSFPFTLTSAMGAVDRMESPHEFALMQNFPNPFNPRTTVRYRIAERGAVQLTITDLLGRGVAVIDRGEQEQGTYSVEIDADKLGLSSGIYFYTLTAGSFRNTKKLLLTK